MQEGRKDRTVGKDVNKLWRTGRHLPCGCGLDIFDRHSSLLHDGLFLMWKFQQNLINNNTYAVFLIAPCPLLKVLLTKLFIIRCIVVWTL